MPLRPLRLCQEQTSAHHYSQEVRGHHWQRRGLSQLDTKGLNLLYRCTGINPTTPTTTTRPTPNQLQRLSQVLLLVGLSRLLLLKPGIHEYILQEVVWQMCGPYTV
ncbi:hypothetical protein Pmani_005056 [Petrolisthes manimaculis]|uniref:Uncharacterized protein n=1 Tax=Petrolisthes manimaculis TaxID=1843537 RepID=A0AAE1QCG7_9EUCA|nr:hypothetical protein Pmani_005056 [Petrolisthes manimaculis]